MAKWKCDICNSEFNNYHAEGFNNKIYCPLCYYKHEYNDLKQQLSQLQQENTNLKKLIKENTILVKDEYGYYQECNIDPIKLQQEKEDLIKWLEGKKQLLRAITDKDGYTHIDELISAKNNLCQEILSKLKESDK